MIRKALPLTGVVAALVALAVPVAAAADSGATMTIAPSATLTARTLVTIQVTINCAPLPPGQVEPGMPASVVSIEQANGKAIAHGFANIPLLTCDGTDQALTLSILADPSGPPFKNGVAVVSGSFSQCSFDPSTFTSTCDSASAGPQSVRLKV